MSSDGYGPDELGFCLMPAGEFEAMAFEFTNTQGDFIMPKSAYHHLSNIQRQQIATLAAKRFAQEITAGEVCRQLGINYSTLKHICNQYRITVPKVRGEPETKSAA